MSELEQIGENAVQAERVLACARGGLKDTVLTTMALTLRLADHLKVELEKI